MPSKVRTVINLDDPIWQRAREVAFQRRVSLSYLANVAFARYLKLKLDVKPQPRGRPKKKRGKKP